MKRLSLLVSLALVGTGCSTPIAHFKLLQKSDFASSSERLPAASKLRPVAGESCKFFNNYLVVYHFRMAPETIDEAIKSIRFANPEVRRIVDLDIRKTSVTSLFVNRYCYEVRGMAETED